MLYVTSSGKTRISTGKLSEAFAWRDQTCRPQQLDDGLVQADLALDDREGKFHVRDFVNGPPTDLLV
ncbi:hypothetical protein FRC01_013956, partial [Tulasnella sp. 417]